MISIPKAPLAACPCGRRFKTTAAVSQHQADKKRLAGDSSACETRKIQLIGAVWPLMPSPGSVSASSSAAVPGSATAASKYAAGSASTSASAEKLESLKKLAKLAGKRRSKPVLQTLTPATSSALARASKPARSSVSASASESRPTKPGPPKTLTVSSLTSSSAAPLPKPVQTPTKVTASASASTQTKTKITASSSSVLISTHARQVTAQASSPAVIVVKGGEKDSKVASQGWMWRNVTSREAIHVITHLDLEPSEALVSGSHGFRLICSYNWLNCRTARIQIPGTAPTWQDIPLPVTLPPDRGTFFVDQNSARIARYPLSPLFRAAACMNQDFRFDNVDIVINRNSLRKLLDFCGSGSGTRSKSIKQSFRMNLFMVKNTLVVERCEKNARELIRGQQQSGWGHNFEHKFTKMPAGAQDSTGHHRVLQYPLGNLRCVVCFEVDAKYTQSHAGMAEQQSLDAVVDQMSTLDLTSQLGTNLTSSDQRMLMSQSTAAEIKTSMKPKGPSFYMPQLWFGRTPWLIIGRHVKGTFDQVRVIDAASEFENWEAKNQVELRKLVAILGRFREAAQRSKGGKCIAICEKGTQPQAIRIYQSKVERNALPDELVMKFWGPGTES